MMVQWIRQFRPALVGLRPAFVGLSIATLIAAVILLRHPVTALVPIPLPPSIGGRDSVPVSDGKYLFYPRSASVIQGVVYAFRCTRTAALTIRLPSTSMVASGTRPDPGRPPTEAPTHRLDSTIPM